MKPILEEEEARKKEEEEARKREKEIYDAFYNGMQKVTTLVNKNSEFDDSDKKEIEGFKDAVFNKII
jgi:hypothetical protein